MKISYFKAAKLSLLFSAYDKLSACVMNTFPKLDGNESGGQLVFFIGQLGWFRTDSMWDQNYCGCDFYRTQVVWSDLCVWLSETSE